MANEKDEIHPLMAKPFPLQPLEFDIPVEATRTRQLDLAWTREQGMGGNGRGIQAQTDLNFLLKRAEQYMTPLNRWRPSVGPRPMY